MNVRFPAGKVSPQFSLSGLMTMEIDADYQSLGFPTGLFSVNVADMAGEHGFERQVLINVAKPSSAYGTVVRIGILAVRWWRQLTHSTHTR